MHTPLSLFGSLLDKYSYLLEDSLCIIGIFILFTLAFLAIANMIFKPEDYEDAKINVKEPITYSNSNLDIFNIKKVA